MRIAVVDEDRCQPEKCEYECINFCPVVRQGKTECIEPRESDGKAKISEELCIGCGICVNKCPFDAIDIINLPEELDEDLVHRFGENAFGLFRLPVPQDGEVVGILGPNGIGKSTAIKILSGEIVPNLGDWDSSPGDGPVGLEDVNEAYWQQILEAYSGTEIGDYLQDVAEGRVTTALKPQYVDKIPRAVEGKVRDLLDRADERGVADELLAELEIEGVADQDVDNLSGGELQRTAVAATLARDADVYFVDEPSSYLDIRQRLKVARLIRELADEGDRSVLVVEHDLAILDYIADNVHLLYGNEGSYGVVALPRPVRTAINVYLDGMMEEENVRFRDHAIEFTAHPPRTSWAGDELLDFGELEKSYGEDEFSLEVDGGAIHEGEVVGVVGPNATGKTTFVKMLADEIEPTAGEVESNVRVAYKPQYITADEDVTVESLMYRALGADYDDGFYRAEVVDPLGVERLEPKQMDQLSGGELQRVATALCLAQEADLYLLDEPSAYLDADQRMETARAIRRVMEQRDKSALVVDHDVYFVDLISDSLMVFSGEPGKRGRAGGPHGLREGMNRFLEDVGVTFRRDEETNRPRVNKPGSRLDREQRSAGEYYYEGQ
jgi:ATP-binding cassette subfamily E protein 1